MSYVYLASPYTHSDPAIRQLRYEQAAHATALFLADRVTIYSPIAQFHHIAFTHRLPFDISFWQYHNAAMLRSARSLYVLTLPGWEESKGVKWEIATALALHIPVHYFSLEELNAQM